MRIHWAVVIFAVVGTILLTWHFRTRHLDFMTPRGIVLGPEDDGSDLATGPIAMQPKIEDGTQTSEVLGNPEEPEEDIIEEITDADLGDLDASPGLDSYRKFGEDNTPDRLFELSSALRARGQFQRALLAFERVIDTTASDSATLDEAAKGINTLAPTLPRWTIDPTTEITLMLHLGTARPAGDALKSAVLEVATLIRTSSSDQIEIVPKITSSGRSVPEDSPIALWLSTDGKKPATTSVITLKASDSEELAIDEISLAIFQSVRAHLAQLGYPTPPPLQAAGKDLLSNYVTRLMWRDLAQSLYQKKDAPAEDDSGSN